jgi:hypothetical protein
MTRRNGEITRADLKRKWPYHAALPAEKVLGFNNSRTRARLLPIRYRWRRGGLICAAMAQSL